jgi:hypothetical protein
MIYKARPISLHNFLEKVESRCVVVDIFERLIGLLNFCATTFTFMIFFQNYYSFYRVKWSLKQAQYLSVMHQQNKDTDKFITAILKDCEILQDIFGCNFFITEYFSLKFP